MFDAGNNREFGIADWTLSKLQPNSRSSIQNICGAVLIFQSSKVRADRPRFKIRSDMNKAVQKRTVSSNLMLDFILSFWRLWWRQRCFQDFRCVTDVIIGRRNRSVCYVSASNAPNWKRVWYLFLENFDLVQLLKGNKYSCPGYLNHNCSYWLFWKIALDQLQYKRQIFRHKR